MKLEVHKIFRINGRTKIRQTSICQVFEGAVICLLGWLR
jgi:hypothetical protein